MRFLAGAVIALALWPAVAAAQEEEPASVLLILDSSKSMADPAGDGRTRMEAAQAAARELVTTLPEDARVGVRVYGARKSGVSREEGCADTELVVPVGPLDRDAVVSEIEALKPTGRTPIGRSLAAAADDLPGSGRRTVILVSDGGDNCAPPEPCDAAREVARGGVDLSIQVVGLQVSEGVREQLECIARVSGGAYVDARDPDALRDELLALFARAFRGYEPSGEPIEGGPTPGAAAEAGTGRWLDSIEPGVARWYAVDVPAGQRIAASATLITPPEAEDSGILDITIVGPDGEELAGEREYHDPFRDAPLTAASALMTAPSDAGGRHLVSVRIEDGDSIAEAPLELDIHVAEPGAEVEPGDAGGTPTPEPSPSPTPEPDEATEEGGSAAPTLAGLGVGGLLLGLIAGAMWGRRR